MKNIKKIALYSLLSFLVLRISCGKEHMGERAANVIANAAVQATEQAAKSGIIMSENAVDASARFGVDAVKIIAPVAQVFVGVYVVSTIADMGTRLYKYHNPNEEEKARINKAREANQYFDAKREFRNCLLKNMKTDEVSSGCPTDCEKLGEQFALAAGDRSELDSMKKLFESMRGK